jgi:hypothetical protein
MFEGFLYGYIDRITLKREREITGLQSGVILGSNWQMLRTGYQAIRIPEKFRII